MNYSECIENARTRIEIIVKPVRSVTDVPVRTRCRTGRKGSRGYSYPQL